MSGPHADLRAKILAATRAAPSPTSGDLKRRRFIGLGVSILWVFGWSLAMHARMPERGGMLLLAVWSAGALLASGYVVLMRRTVGPPRGLMRTMAPIIGVAVAAASLVIGATWGHERAAGAHEVAIHLECWLASMLVGAGPLAAALWVDRNSDPVAPGATAAGLGALAGAWAGVAMSFVCGRTDTVHTLASHVAELIVLSALGALVGRRVLAMR